ncbi:hypothetical protein [Alkalihalobacillus sp. BA299]|uniref:hypothetical protein n=1 Tax=Alkalihalobacillus sp. BA299 TaxID=2815938 RepID=UPI001ADA5915|nr:hypothetical protein [Alkalihalobacillus sp. BA299]
MNIYRTFIKRLLRNYIIGSLVSVFRVGTVLMFTTISLNQSKGTQWEAQFVDYFAEYLIEKNFMINKEEYTKVAP